MHAGSSLASCPGGRSEALQSTDTSPRALMQHNSDCGSWSLVRHRGPLLATAIHAGHEIRSSIRPFMRLTAADRLREEDPFTGAFAPEGATLLRVNTSRFEVDLNRARDGAVYAGPDSAWGLDVWREALPAAEIEASLTKYDRFYKALFAVLRQKLTQHPRLVVLDLHSYNHRREGPEGPLASAVENPVVNVGTAAADRGVWGPLIEGFTADLAAQSFEGGRLDARENVKFTGGELSRHLAREFGSKVLTLSVEFKKVFMDEWTGEKDPERVRQLREALTSCTRPLRAACRATP